MRIRIMTADDRPLGMHLVRQAGWNQTEADWQRFLAMEPQGCFVAEVDGREAGTATACTFGPIGWIAMVLVDKAMRGRGIGTALVQRALAYLDEHGVRTVRLDATPLGRPVYERLGFMPEYELVRLEGQVPAASPHEAVRLAEPGHFDAILQLDRAVSGTDRRKLLGHLAKQQTGAVYVFVRDGALQGYLMTRGGSRAWQIGPAVTRDEATGPALGDTALARCGGEPVFVDIPTDNRPAVGWAQSRGLVVQRSFVRMGRGAPVDDRPGLLWASSGPEHG